MIPVWLHILSLLFVALGLLCAGWVAVDVYRHPQHMGVMNIVWPVVALFGTVLTVWLYRRYGRLATECKALPAMVAKGAAHCGSGCCIGDICAEWLAFAFPVVATWLGWHHLFEEKVFAVWILDFLLAFTIGIVFQYFTIAPMRKLGVLEGIWAAIKADTLSLAAWQVGMYGFMALANFWLFRSVLGTRLQVDSVEFWFMMQIAMLFGFASSYPVNWWLIEAGVKERM